MVLFGMVTDNYTLTVQSSNQKVGMGVAVSTSNSSTCPDSCPLKNKECYARFGPLAIHWRHIDNGKRGVPWSEFVSQVKALPREWKFRHNQAGDLPGENEEVDSAKLSSLSKAIKERKLKAWTYTHKPLNESNSNAIKSAIADGFVINVSADTPEEADSAHKAGFPTVLTVAIDAENHVTPNGNKVVICPAQTKNISCSECMLCHKANRTCIVGFKAHGTAAKKLNAKLK
jgi:hypothetical protein